MGRIDITSRPDVVQNESGVLSTNMSWSTYAQVFIAAAAVIGVAYMTHDMDTVKLIDIAAATSLIHFLNKNYGNN